MEIYLDNASTTKLHPKVMDTMNQTYHQYYGNPSSVHKAGYEANKRIETARSQLLSQLNAHNHQLIFTSGGTESNNLAIVGMINQHQKKTGNWHCSVIEHPSVLKIYEHMKKRGLDVFYIPVLKNGIIDIDHLSQRVTKNTRMVSVMHINNETGIIQPIEKITEVIKEKSPHTFVHVDGVQAFGKINVDLSSIKADFYTISGHKLGGPRGVGALVAQKNIPLHSIIWGGGQESGVRPGTENVPGIVGLEMAGMLSHLSIKKNIAIKQRLRECFIYALKRAIEDVLIIEHPLQEYQYPGILSLSIPYIRSEVMLRLLSDDEIYVSSGSACSSKDAGASHVLKAMKINPIAIDGTLRISFDHSLTEDQIHYVVGKISIYAKEMRKMIKR